MFRKLMRRRPPSARRSGFFLFPPLVCLAMFSVFFDLLPMEVQYYILPGRVSKSEVWDEFHNGSGYDPTQQFMDMVLAAHEYRSLQAEKAEVAQD